ncbi:hypothetical protein AcW2_007239 [Taiwanofungus camphoratus]|nr:hypothetical protein AcW2_007239 [Antrodia cinnamomea]
MSARTDVDPPQSLCAAQASCSPPSTVDEVGIHLPCLKSGKSICLISNAGSIHVQVLDTELRHAQLRTRESRKTTITSSIPYLHNPLQSFNLTSITSLFLGMGNLSVF